MSSVSHISGKYLTTRLNRATRLWPEQLLSTGAKESIHDDKSGLTEEQDGGSECYGTSSLKMRTGTCEGRLVFDTVFWVWGGGGGLSKEEVGTCSYFTHSSDVKMTADISKVIREKRRRPVSD